MLSCVMCESTPPHQNAYLYKGVRRRSGKREREGRVAVSSDRKKRGKKSKKRKKKKKKEGNDNGHRNRRYLRRALLGLATFNDVVFFPLFSSTSPLRHRCRTISHISCIIIYDTITTHLFSSYNNCFSSICLVRWKFF